MIKKILIILMVVVFAGTLTQAQGIKRVPNKKKDSTKTETAVKNEQPPKEPTATSKKPESQKPKDEFIDRDGDGINDKMNVAKPPAIKKQEPPKPKPEQPRQIQPPPKPKEQPKEEPKKDTEKKKSKR